MNGRFSGSGRKNPHPKGKQGGAKTRKGKLLKLPKTRRDCGPASLQESIVAASQPTRSYASAIEAGGVIHDPFSGSRQRWEPGEV